MEFDIFTLLPLVVAVVVFWKLRSVLGTRTGNERPPYDRSSQDNESAFDHQNNDNVVTLPHVKRRRDDEKVDEDAALKEVAGNDTDLLNGLKAIVEKDAAFDVAQFIDGSKMAYEMIVMGFAEGDKRALKGLLSREVYENFAAGIDERTKRNEKVQTSFVGIEKTKLMAADVVEKEAQITVQFISQMVSVTLDDKDAVVEGDANEVVEITDIWTFARSTQSNDPNWKLIATDG